MASIDSINFPSRVDDASITIFRHESLTPEEVLDLLVEHYKAWCVGRPGGRR